LRFSPTKRTKYKDLLRLELKSRFALLLAMTLAVCSLPARGYGQTPTTSTPASSEAPSVERKLSAPQVLTVLHRINGLKMLRLLLRSGAVVGAVDNLDQGFELTGQVHTNIIAGLALDDGQTIAAWLPEAEVEVETSWPFSTAPETPLTPGTWPFSVPDAPGREEPRSNNKVVDGVNGAFGTFAGSVLAGPDITIVEHDGRRFEARYIGLDGITGLSLLKIAGRSLPSISDVNALEIAVGQPMHLFSPEPAPENGAPTNKAIYVRLGEIDGQIVSLSRGLSGEINRIRIKSLKLSPSNIGGVAVNNAGQIIGIVESIEGTEANVLSPWMIRGAAKRVLARQASVPRPWLGISGEPVAFASLDRIIRKGWEAGPAMALLEKQRGILLNSVAPGSPAALAALRAGDVIVSVNDSEIKSTEDFSQLLTAALGDPVRFTIVRPHATAAESITVKPGESLDPRFALNPFGPVARALGRSPLIGHGIETVPLRTAAATRFGSKSGLLVIYVQPVSAAFKAGLRPGDVIEAIDGQPIPVGSSIPRLERGAKASFVLNVIRKKAKLVFTVEERTK
jgi:serine protease Do